MAKKKKILIIEDEAFLGEVLVEKLNNAGYEATLARDGGSGIERMREDPPDLLLLDIALPVKNGYQVAEEARSEERLASIPIIVISNSGQFVEKDKMEALGVKDFIIKVDFDPADVLDKVAAILKTTSDKEGDAEDAPAKPDQKKYFTPGTKVVILEDDKLITSILIRDLEREGCTAVSVVPGRGDDVLSVLRKEQPDIALFDIMLPGTNGLDVMRQVRQDEDLKNLPVLILSNLGEEADIKTGKEAGADGYLIKGEVSLDKIMREMRRILDKKR